MILKRKRNNAKNDELNGKLAVVTSYFNPVGYERLKQNYMQFAEDMKSQGADLSTVEVAFGEDHFFLTPGEKVLQIRTPDILWQKERALNALIDSLPSEYDKVAWIDADILFENSNWMKDLSDVLKDVPVAQCFSSVTKYGSDATSINCKLLSVANVAKNSGIDAVDFRKHHTGFAWAARRSFLSKFHLYDYSIVGGNDSLMAMAFFGLNDHPDLSTKFNDKMIKPYELWRANVQRIVNKSVGCVEGNIRHHWHGDFINRQYLDRYNYLIENDFDCIEDIQVGEDKLWHWATDKPELHERIGKYFCDRKDDG